MKVLHTIYSGLGGHFSVAFALIEADIKKIYSHKIIFYGIEDIPQAYIDKCKLFNIEFKVIKKKKGIDFGSSFKFYNYVKNYKTDILLLSSINLIIPAWFYRVIFLKKIIAIEHQANHLKTKIEWIRSILLQLLASKVVFLTDIYLIEVKKKIRFFFRAKKSIVINNGINLEIYNNNENNKPAPEYTAGMMSRLTPIKDHSTLLKAILFLKNEKWYGEFRLMLAGDGETRVALEAEAQALGIENKIVFLGMLDESRLLDFLQSISIYVHASYGETMSTSIMQVMACKLPIIASDVPGINNMVINEVNGLLVPVKNEKRLAEAISLLMNDRATAEKLAKAAYDFAVSNYSNQRMFEKYQVVFEDK